MVLPGIILIEDDQARCQQFSDIFEFLEYQIEITSSFDFAPDRNLGNNSVIFVGDNIKKLGSVINQIQQHAANAAIILLVDKGSSQQATNAIQQFLSEVLQWPTTYTVLNDTLKKIKDKQPLQKLTNISKSRQGLAGNSDAINKTRTLIEQVAGSDATVLILGESGYR